MSSVRQPNKVVVTQDTRPSRVVKSDQTDIVEIRTGGAVGPQGEEGPIGPAGPTGGQGPQGPAGDSLSITSYTHIQSAVANDWVIMHNLHFSPNVSSFDSAGSEVVGEIEQVNNDELILHFTSAFTGVAYLS